MRFLQSHKRTCRAPAETAGENTCATAAAHLDVGVGEKRGVVIVGELYRLTVRQRRHVQALVLHLYAGSNAVVGFSGQGNAVLQQGLPGVVVAPQKGDGVHALGAAVLCCVEHALRAIQAQTQGGQAGEQAQPRHARTHAVIYELLGVFFKKALLGQLCAEGHDAYGQVAHAALRRLEHLMQAAVRGGGDGGLA